MMRNALNVASMYQQPAEGFKLNILTANLLFALALLVFVVFFCVRMISNTKIAAIAVFTCVVAGGAYHISHMASAYEVFCLLLGSVPIIFGFFCCMLSTCAIVLALAEEENSEEYVHGRKFYGSFIVLFYIGLLLFATTIDTGLL